MHKYFLNAGRIFKDIAGEVQRYRPGNELLPGIVTIPAYGHTPGHTAFALHSQGRSMLVMMAAQLGHQVELLDVEAVQAAAWQALRKEMPR